MKVVQLARGRKVSIPQSGISDKERLQKVIKSFDEFWREFLKERFGSIPDLQRIYDEDVASLMYLVEKQSG